MRYREDNYEMVEGETNKLEIDLSPTIGANTISSFAIEASGLTFTTPSLTDRGVTTFVSGGIAGTDYTATTTAHVSDGQVKVGAIKLEWKAPGCQDRARWN